MTTFIVPGPHRGLDRLDTLASLRDGLIERGLEPLIGFEQHMPIIRRGDTGAGCLLRCAGRKMRGGATPKV